MADFNWQQFGSGLASGAEGTTSALVRWLAMEEEKKEKQRQEKLQMPMLMAKQQYYERGHQPKEEKPPTASDLLDQAKLESYLGLTPDEQKRINWPELFKEDKPDKPTGGDKPPKPAKPPTDASKRAEHKFAKGLLKEQAPYDEESPETNLSPEQNWEWLNNILGQMRGGVPYENIEPPRIDTTYTRAEEPKGGIKGLWADIFGGDPTEMKTTEHVDTSFFPFSDQVMPDMQTPKPPYESDSEIEKARRQLTDDQFNEWLPRYLKSIGK